MNKRILLIPLIFSLFISSCTTAPDSSSEDQSSTGDVGSSEINSSNGESVNELSEIYSSYCSNGGKLDYQTWLSYIVEVEHNNVYSGEGAPSDSLGDDKDLYFDVISFALYSKNNSSWKKISEFKDAQYLAFKKKYNDYQGDYEDYLEDYANGLLNDEYQYNYISYGREIYGSIINNGTVVREDNYLSFTDAVVKMDEKVILPVNANSSWELSFKGILNTSGQYLNSNYFNDNPDGRIYFGINATNGLFIGVNIDGNFFNYCFSVPSDYLTTNHRYIFTYEDGIYYISIDGNNKSGFASKNVNQTNSVAVTDIRAASNELNSKIIAATGQEYFHIRYMGADGFLFKGKMENLSFKTGPIYNYRNLEKHPIDNKMIYQLGSSISYGTCNAGRSFVEQISQLTNSRYVKETVSGTTLAIRSGFDNSYVERFNNLNLSNNPDFLIVQLSTNDFYNNVSIGTVNLSKGSSNTYDKYTISGAIEYIISRTKELSPNTKVAFYSCPIKDSWAFKTQYKSFAENELKTIVDKWDIVYIDLFHQSLVSGFTFLVDDIHPNGIGYADAFTPYMINSLIKEL